MSISLTTSHTSKSCNYNKAAGRWEELESPPSVCSCCDSICTDILDSVKNTVSSPGWFIGQNGEEKPRMKAISFQSEEGQEWLAQEGKREEIMDEHLKKVQTFPQETEIGHEEEKEEAIPEKTRTVSQHGNKEKEEGETEEVVIEKADSQLKEFATDGLIMSDQTRPGETEMVQARVPSTKNVVSGLFNENSSTNVSRDGSGSTTITRGKSSFGIDYDNTSNHGSAENVSTAVIHIIKHCPNSDKISCNATNSAIKAERGSNIARHGTMYTAIGDTPYNVRGASGTSKFGSVWDSSVHESPLGSRLETLAGTHSATSHFEIDPPGVLDVRNSVKSRLESDKLDTVLGSEQGESIYKSVDTKFDRIPGQAGDSVISKGPHRDDMIHSVQIRGLESDQSVHPAGFRYPICVGGLLCESDFDSGIEGEVRHPSQFTGAVKTKKELQELYGTITRPHSVSSGSVSLEQMHQDNPSHSAVVTVNTTLQGSESRPMSEWAEVVPGWGLQSLGFVVEQPTQVEEELRQEVMDDFY